MTRWRITLGLETFFVDIHVIAEVEDALVDNSVPSR